MIWSGWLWNFSNSSEIHHPVGCIREGLKYPPGIIQARNVKSCDFYFALFIKLLPLDKCRHIHVSDETSASISDSLAVYDLTGGWAGIAMPGQCPQIIQILDFDMFKIHIDEIVCYQLF